MFPEVKMMVMIRSFGAGVYESQLVPPELVDGTKDIKSYIIQKLEEFQLGNIESVVADDSDVSSFFVLVDRGNVPSEYEIRMMARRFHALNNAAQNVEKFKNRVKELSKYYDCYE